MATTKILCAVDFSEGSASAIRTAVRLANEADAELVLAHAWFVPATAFSELAYPSAMVQALQEEAQKGLDLAIADAKAAGAKRVTGSLHSGVPWVSIVHEATDPDYKLLVVGTHGRTGLSRVLVGSVAEKIVRHSPCSVMVVRPDSPASAYQHVLCPIDFSDNSRDAMMATAEYARAGGRGITLLHAVELPNTWTNEAPVLDYARDLDGRAAKMLESWAEELRAKVDLPVTALTRVGNPAGETLALLEADPSIDLVVMGSHGRTGIKRALLGSVAERVIRHARCPVVVTRTRE